MSKTKAEVEQDERDAETVHQAGKKGAAPLAEKEQTALEQAAARAQQAEDDKKALEQLRAQQNATPAKQAREDAAKKAEVARKEREGRTVQVRALKRGFYPADGQIREPGDVFDYVFVKDEETDVVETELPSWMEAVDGSVKTRVLSAKPATKPLVIEVHGQGPSATVAKGAAK